MPTIAEIRQKYPQYSDMSDDSLATALHKKFYSDLPREAVLGKLGMTGGGLTPPPVAARQAETESMAELAENPPDTRQQPILPRMTYGMITPESTQMLTASAGGLLGVPAGPAGMVAGGGLGAAAGPGMFRGMEALARRVRGMAPYDTQTTGEAFKEAGKAGMEDMAWGAGTMAAGPALRRMGKPLVGKILGVNNPASRRITDLGAAHGIDIGTAHVSPRKAVRGASTVLGVFPFVGTPLRKGQERIVGQISDEAADLLNTLAPYKPSLDVGKSLAGKAAKRFGAHNRVASSLYKRFYDVADNLSVKDIVPTDPLKAKLADIGEIGRKEAITLSSGKPMANMNADLVGDFLKQVDELPDLITVEQARGLERTLNTAIYEGGKQGFDISRLGQMKGALNDAKNSLDLSRLSQAEADDVVSAWNGANKFFAETQKTFSTPTAKRFGKVDRNIFGKGVFKPGTANSDELFSGVFKAKSPEALADLRKIVGDRGFRAAARSHLQNELVAATKPAKEGALVERLFSAAAFRKNLGLNRPEGWSSMKEMLKGSQLGVGELKHFLEVVDKASDIVIRDPSTFLTRRLVLGGGLAGGMLVAGGKMSIPAAALVTYMARKGAKFLMDPRQLRLMTRVLQDTATDHQRRVMLTRLIRLSERQDKEKPRTP